MPAATWVNAGTLVAEAPAARSWSTWGWSDDHAACTTRGAEARSAVILGATLSKASFVVRA